jgi:hypothetical protein
MYSEQKVNYIFKMGNTRKLNCWGATLLILKEKNRLEWVTARRMDKFLKRRTKNVNDANKGLKLGDILVIRDKDSELVHTAVYVGNDNWFHKRGALNSQYDHSRDIVLRYKRFGAENWEIRRLK